LNGNWSEEETDDLRYADERNFYKVERWSRDTQRIEAMLYAGSNLDKAQDVFAKAVSIGADHNDHPAADARA
jgi:hypothetical protein